MKYDEFMKVTEVLKPEEAGSYTELLPWGGCERVQIDRLTLDETNSGNSRAKITAKHIILKVIRLCHFRIGEAGGVYLNNDIYEAYDPEVREKRFREKRTEIEQELRDHRASVDAERKSSASQRPDIPVEEAVGKQLKEILDHNEWLKEQGRADEQDIPF